MLIETTTTIIEDITSNLPTTPVWNKPDFEIYVSFSQQEMFYLSSGESLALTCNSNSTYPAPLNTMIYKDRVIGF